MDAQAVSPAYVLKAKNNPYRPMVAMGTSIFKLQWLKFIWKKLKLCRISVIL